MIVNSFWCREMHVNFPLSVKIFFVAHHKILLLLQAFRQVRFEGLPSLPSRATSSNITRRSCSSPVPSISDCGRGDTTDEYLKRCMANLQPAWDKVEKTVKKARELSLVYLGTSHSVHVVHLSLHEGWWWHCKLLFIFILMAFKWLLAFAFFSVNGS